MTTQISIYLEIGEKKTFACAIDWPGWSRAGRDEASALQALLDSAPRYAQVLNAAKIKFQPPADTTAFTITERLQGNATTDFGAPDLAPESDSLPVGNAELERLQALLKAYWQALDAAVQAASGKELRKGSRGGGREVEGILDHVLHSETSYLGKLGWKFKLNEKEGLDEQLKQQRAAVLEGMAASARGEIPAQGPRGGLRWSLRYFVRRAGWHVLDHAWEIEERVMSDE